MVCVFCFSFSFVISLSVLVFEISSPFFGGCFFGMENVGCMMRLSEAHTFADCGSCGSSLAIHGMGMSSTLESLRSC